MLAVFLSDQRTTLRLSNLLVSHRHRRRRRARLTIHPTKCQESLAVVVSLTRPQTSLTKVCVPCSLNALATSCSPSYFLVSVNVLKGQTNEDASSSSSSSSSTSEDWKSESHFDSEKDKSQFRRYEEACDRVKAFYKEQHGTFPELTICVLLYRS